MSTWLFQKTVSSKETVKIAKPWLIYGPNMVLMICSSWILMNVSRDASRVHLIQHLEQIISFQLSFIIIGPLCFILLYFFNVIWPSIWLTFMQKHERDHLFHFVLIFGLSTSGFVYFGLKSRHQETKHI